MMTPSNVQDYLTTSTRIPGGDFVFVVCQHGTESSIKQFLGYPNSPFRLAFSRPGLLTFKVDSPVSPPQHPLIRLSGRVLGQVEGSSPVSMIGALKDLVDSSLDKITPKLSSLENVHIFERDRAATGQFGFEPGTSKLVDEILQQTNQTWLANALVNQIVSPRTMVLDCILADTNRWIMGCHAAEQLFECWPGGVFPVSEPSGMISRAYFKMAEGIAWSQFPIELGDRVVEIGSAPGGASQRLLDMGLVVTGVDPAEMNPLLLQHPRFEHWRSKSSAVKRKNYSKFRWLVADANVAPNYTLDCVGDIVTYPTSSIEGMILTLKLSSYDMLTHLDDYLKRISSWGYPRVQAKQLSHNRHELCVVAQR